MVYGHHMKSGLMFAHLEDFEKADFYKNIKRLSLIRFMRSGSMRL